MPTRFHTHHGKAKRIGCPEASSAEARSIRAPTRRHNPTKSRMVQWWMFGVAYQGSGRVSVIGIRPRSSNSLRTRQWPKFGNDTIAWRPIRKRCSSTSLGWRVAWIVCDRIT